MDMEGMHNFLRSWRQDALDRQQYDTAIFVGDKLLALTKSDEDTLALAHTHFAAANYTRALAYASRSELVHRKASARYLAGHCYIKQNRHDDALALLGDKNPVHLMTTADGARRKLQHISNGLSSRQHGKSRMPNRTDRVDRSEERDREDAANLKYEAGMCYLRGLCFAKQNAFDRAKECYKDAVRIDVQCFEAFDQLVRNALMTPEEEWQFLDSLNFDSIQPAAGETAAVPEAADFTKNLYTMRLNKYTRREEFDAAIENLENYKLEDNPDILLAKAEKLFNASRLRSAVELTTEILDSDPYNFACIPLHLSLLHKLNEVNTLFSLSHDLADTHPQEPCTWLAVGTYYLASNRIPEARSYFSKASMMDPHFGPAWIGFAHTFAEEGESDQAIAAYSTAARLFQGSHLPQLFLGMQEIALGNLSIAREYLTAAYNLCKTDPLLINELGLVSYMDDDLEPAIRHFTLALSIVDENEAPMSQYAVIRLNLAHAYRRAGQYEEALEEFDEVIRLGMQDAGVFTSKGLTLLELGQPFDATVAFHSALAISPQDPIATELLKKALDQLEKAGGSDDTFRRAKAWISMVQLTTARLSRTMLHLVEAPLALAWCWWPNTEAQMSKVNSVDGDDSSHLLTDEGVRRGQVLGMPIHHYHETSTFSLDEGRGERLNVKASRKVAPWPDKNLDRRGESISRMGFVVGVHGRLLAEVEEIGCVAKHSRPKGIAGC